MEESSIAETQESSGSDITDEVSDGSSREDSSDPEYQIPQSPVMSAKQLTLRI